MAQPNALFAIINVSNPAALEVKLSEARPWIALKLDVADWLLIAPNATTTKEVSDRLGFDGPGMDTGVVLRVENYFGRENPSVWEWISTKQGAELGTVAVG